MKEQLLLLYRLQETDTQFQDDEQELEELDPGEELAGQLEEQGTELAQLEQKLSEAQAQIHDKQLQLQSTEDDRESKWDQAYAGTVFDPRKLSALEQKIAELDRRKGKLEEDIILLLDEVETLEQQAADKRTEVDQMSNQLAQIRDHFEQRSRQLRQKLERLANQRQELEGEVEAELLEQYERIRQRSHNVVVAVVRDSRCSACHTAVATSLIGQLRQPDGLVTCENCRRILVLDRWL